MKNEPEIVVFDDKSLKSARVNGSNKSEWKAFMSSKVSKTSLKPPAAPQDAKELEEEELDRQNDLELEELLKTTKLLEEYTAEEIGGKDRRKYIEKRMTDLGAKPKKGVKTPIPITIGMNLKRKDREKKELEEAKNLGLYHRSIKHVWAASAKKKSNNRKNRGIGVGLGKVKDGILTLSSQDIRRVQSAGVKKKRKGTKRLFKNL
ncbi:485_t:CDS:2 [Paraglomus occultum]|uniref:485_t:CDS:1 n=1 Tax=Paraglomus occultum TaxID=144539 RepID=A0A9N9AEN3_9GLOM|nr:485_t:CDS:2 [Paraglomus occultum]